MLSMKAKVSVGLMMAIMGSSVSWAIDYQPFDWVWLPPGTNVMMGYYEYGEHDEFNNTITGTANAHLDSDVGIARYLHYGDLFYGHHWDVNIVVPFGSLNEGRIDSYRLNHASGIGDPIVTAGMWFISQPEQKRWLSAADYVTLPIGTYDNHKALNLGGHRWQNDIQADFTQGFLDKFTLDVSVDWVYYGNNSEAGTGHQLLTQNSTYGAYAWVSYDVSDIARRVLPSASNATISIGYAQTIGGKQKLDGVETGAETVEHQIRLTYMMFLNPTWQGLLSVNHDDSVAGQFRQNFGLVFRVAKLF
jgi:Putative MetA-pathway of phenol degradation